MAIMEITTVGESESDLRRVVFKTKSLVVKVVFDKLLQVIKEFDVTTLQDIAIRLTRPFPASKSQEVAVEAVVAVEDETNIELTSEKMSLKENSEKLSLASEEIVDKLATFDENISLEKGKIMKNKGAEMRQNLVKESVELVFNYGAKDNKTLNVQMSELEDTPNVAKVKLASLKRYNGLGSTTHVFGLPMFLTIEGDGLFRARDEFSKGMVSGRLMGSDSLATEDNWLR
ncbi:hypothetical protein V6N13_030786 [Hibiscus sabdariffa]